MWVSTSDGVNALGYSTNNALSFKKSTTSVTMAAYCVDAYSFPPVLVSDVSSNNTQLNFRSLVAANASVSLLGNFSVNADLTIHGNWSLGSQPNVRASGTLMVNAKETTLLAGGVLSSNVLIVNPNTVLIVSASSSGSGVVSYPLASYNQLHGQLSDIHVAGSSPGNGPSVSIQYSSTSATILLHYSAATSSTGSSLTTTNLVTGTGAPSADPEPATLSSRNCWNFCWVRCCCHSRCSSNCFGWQTLTEIGRSANKQSFEKECD